MILFVFFGIRKFVKIGMYGIMRNYAYLTLRNKTAATRLVCQHCAILDTDTMLCYHLSSDGGYMCESWHDLMQRYDMVDRVDFVSDKDIDSFMHYYALRYGDYDVLHNNCEMFANCFSGRELNNQNRMYNIVGIILLTALLFALIKR